MSKVVEKKRELIPEFNALIQKLISCSGDLHRLELQDNLEAYKRVKKTLIELRNEDIKEFEVTLSSVRVSVRANADPNKPKNPARVAFMKELVAKRFNK